MLDERGRRRFAGAEAIAAGRGGIMAVWRATGIARSTIGRALAELRSGETPDPDRVRRPGGGDKPATQTDPSLLDDLRSLIEPTTRGDPQSPLLWTCKSLSNLAEGLRGKGHEVGRTLVEKTATRRLELHAAGQPQDARRVEPSRSGRAIPLHQRPGEGRAERGRTRHLHRHQEEGTRRRLQERRARMAAARARPKRFASTTSSFPNSGARRLTASTTSPTTKVGSASASTTTRRAFAVNAIRSWWRSMGRERYPDARSLLITADGGGSNGSRVRLWKLELQKLADELGVPITVCHLPPGTSKWNRIEHRLFAFITGNWRGKPLVSHAVIVQLIAATKTRAGLEGPMRTRSQHLPCRRQSLRRGSRRHQHRPQSTSTANGTTPSSQTLKICSVCPRTGP